jgi:hypothetical protein
MPGLNKHKVVIVCRCARRFVLGCHNFLGKTHQNGKYTIPNDLKPYLMATYLLHISNCPKIFQMNIKYTYQHYPFQVAPKYTLIGIFVYENRPSGNPGIVSTQVGTASLLYLSLFPFVCFDYFRLHSNDPFCRHRRSQCSREAFSKALQSHFPTTVYMYTHIHKHVYVHT